MCFLKSETECVMCKDNQNKIETVWGFPCDKASERMANSQDPDQTAPSEKVIAFICFNFMNKKNLV